MLRYARAARFHIKLKKLFLKKIIIFSIYFGNRDSTSNLGSACKNSRPAGLAVKGIRTMA
jgi:hypothetical protein